MDAYPRFEASFHPEGDFNHSQLWSISLISFGGNLCSNFVTTGLLNQTSLRWLNGFGIGGYGAYVLPSSSEVASSET